MPYNLKVLSIIFVVLLVYSAGFVVVYQDHEGEITSRPKSARSIANFLYSEDFYFKNNSKVYFSDSNKRDTSVVYNETKTVVNKTFLVNESQFINIKKDAIVTFNNVCFIIRKPLFIFNYGELIFKNVTFDYFINEVNISEEIPQIAIIVNFAKFDVRDSSFNVIGSLNMSKFLSKIPSVIGIENYGELDVEQSSFNNFPIAISTKGNITIIKETKFIANFIGVHAFSEYSFLCTNSIFKNNFLALLLNNVTEAIIMRNKILYDRNVETAFLSNGKGIVCETRKNTVISENYIKNVNMAITIYLKGNYTITDNNISIDFAKNNSVGVFIRESYLYYANRLATNITIVSNNISNLENGIIIEPDIVPPEIFEIKRNNFQNVRYVLYQGAQYRYDALDYLGYCKLIFSDNFVTNGDLVSRFFRYVEFYRNRVINGSLLVIGVEDAIIENNTIYNGNLVFKHCINVKVLNNQIYSRTGIGIYCILVQNSVLKENIIETLEESFLIQSLLEILLLSIIIFDAYIFLKAGKNINLMVKKKEKWKTKEEFSNKFQFRLAISIVLGILILGYGVKFFNAQCVYGISFRMFFDLIFVTIALYLLFLDKDALKTLLYIIEYMVDFFRKTPLVIFLRNVLYIIAMIYMIPSINLITYFLMKTSENEGWSTLFMYLITNSNNTIYGLFTVLTFVGILLFLYNQLFFLLLTIAIIAVYLSLKTVKPSLRILTSIYTKKLIIMGRKVAFTVFLTLTVTYAVYYFSFSVFFQPLVTLIEKSVYLYFIISLISYLIFIIMMFKIPIESFYIIEIAHNKEIKGTWIYRNFVLIPLSCYVIGYTILRIIINRENWFITYKLLLVVLIATIFGLALLRSYILLKRAYRRFLKLIMSKNISEYEIVNESLNKYSKGFSNIVENVRVIESDIKGPFYFPFGQNHIIFLPTKFMHSELANKDVITFILAHELSHITFDSDYKREKTIETIEFGAMISISLILIFNNFLYFILDEILMYLKGLLNKSIFTIIMAEISHISAYLQRPLFLLMMEYLVLFSLFKALRYTHISESFMEHRADFIAKLITNCDTLKAIKAKVYFMGLNENIKSKSLLSSVKSLLYGNNNKVVVVFLDWYNLVIKNKQLRVIKKIKEFFRKKIQKDATRHTILKISIADPALNILIADLILRGALKIDKIPEFTEDDLFLICKDEIRVSKEIVKYIKQHKKLPNKNIFEGEISDLIYFNSYFVLLLLLVEEYYNEFSIHVNSNL